MNGTQPHKLTLAYAKELVKEYGCTLRKNEYGEYVVKDKQGNTYFGGSLQDAIQTAVVMMEKQ